MLSVCEARLTHPRHGKVVAIPIRAPATFFPQATDADSGRRGAITFSIASVVLVQDNGVSQPFENLFKVVTTAKDDSYVGSIQ